MDDFIEQSPGFMQAIIRRAVGRGESSVAFLTTVTTPSALPGGVEGMANDVTFAKLSMKTASRIGTTAI